jgi:hypothetical protein
MIVTSLPMRVRTPDGTHEWALDWAEGDQGDILTLRALDSRRWTAAGSTVFHAQMVLRGQVEPEGILLCCNGARENVYPSRLALSMADGEVAYQLRWGRRPSTRHLVEVLGLADCADVVTIQEQKAWFEWWSDSVTGWKYPLNALVAIVRPGRTNRQESRGRDRPH